jgi:hypothetical protein
VRFEFLGQVTITAGIRRVGAHGEQPALVVARLVLDRPSPLPREELADLLWPTNRPVRWEGRARRRPACIVTPDEAITSLAASRFAFPPNSNWLLATATVGDAVVLTGRREHAPVLLALLEPYADREVALNCFGSGAYWGR